jgi:DNA polymerase I-like protein with 3'-5' exonuclease and polymerase domains
MRQVVLDFETFYSKDYSLKNMTPIEYVLDPRFEMIGCAVIEDEGEPFWVDGDKFTDYLSGLDASDTMMISHNALFDMCIVAWCYHFVPKLMVDTMGMARALLQYRIPTGRVSLSSCAMALDVGVKGDAVTKVEGYNAAAIKQAGLWDEYVNYAINDAELCKKIYDKLKPSFPPSEYVVMDSIIRCVMQPKFEVDQYALAMHLHSIKQNKQTLLAKCALMGIEKREDLQSAEKFAQALQTFGVDPPRKVSKLTGKETYAFAKTDPGLIKLEYHENPDVQALVAARLGIKSTIEETRTARLLNIAKLTPKLPVPLKYGGAHTHRLSGDWSLNLQNLPRGSVMRDALKAPANHKVVTCDASQIEARITALLCGARNLIEQFRNGEDTYSIFATEVYGRPINKRDNPAERFVGKQAILGLGFGMGAPRFHTQIKSDSYKQGIKVDVDENKAIEVVGIFRKTYPKFQETWNILGGALGRMATNKELSETFGPVRMEYQRILLPNGLALQYHNLRQEDNNWVYDYGREKRKLFGGKVLENIVQALARIIVFDAMVRLRRILRVYDVRLVHTVHDELVYVVPNELVNVVKKIVHDEMVRPPTWMSDLPLAAEVGVGDNYGDAK